MTLAVGGQVTDEAGKSGQHGSDRSMPALTKPTSRIPTANQNEATSLVSVKAVSWGFLGFSWGF